jgi:hypothetical protein
MATDPFEVLLRSHLMDPGFGLGSVGCNAHKVYTLQTPQVLQQIAPLIMLVDQVGYRLAFAAPGVHGNLTLCASPAEIAQPQRLVPAQLWHETKLAMSVCKTSYARVFACTRDELVGVPLAALYNSAKDEGLDLFMIEDAANTNTYHLHCSGQQPIRPTVVCPATPPSLTKPSGLYQSRWMAGGLFMIAVLMLAFVLGNGRLWGIEALFADQSIWASPDSSAL